MNWVFCRDEIVIDDVFKQELLKEIDFRRLPRGSSLLIAARTIRHAANYVLQLESYSLSLYADRYESNGGGIDVGGSAGAAGASGALGADGYASAGGANDKPGGPGGKGDNGKRGIDGAALTVASFDVGSLRLSSTGGSGGAGGKGGNGGKGGDGKAETRNHPGWDGTGGGAGANGGSGAPGASGGAVGLFFVVASTAALQITTDGGAGGAAGGAGSGGKKGALAEAPDGPAGSMGSPGQEGAAGAQIKGQLTEHDFWQTIRLEAAAALTWAEYRFRVGEYLFRAFKGDDPSRSHYLERAEHELTCVMRLNPGHSKAQLMLTQLQFFQTPHGLPRTLDLVPEFERYERVTTDYYPLITPMFETAVSMLELSHEVDANKARLGAQIPHLETTLQILSLEQSAAALEVGAANTVLAGVDAAVNALSVEVEQNRLELEKWRVDLEGRKVQSVFQICVAVIAVIAAAYSGGASLAAVPGLMLSAKDAWKEITYDPKSKTVKYQGQGIATWFTWETGVPKLKPEIQALAKGLEDVVKKAIDIIDKVRVLQEIDASEVNGDLLGKGRALMRRSAELSMDRAMAINRLQQSMLRGQAIDLRSSQALADIGDARTQQAVMRDDIRFLGETARVLISAARSYLDIVGKYVFLAARSLEIFTFSDYRFPVAFDQGYVHPDVEEAAYLALDRGDSSRVLGLLSSYVTSLRNIPGVIFYRDQYETYRSRLTGDLQYWLFDAPARIQSFKDSQRFEFKINLHELLPGRYEAKVEHVFAALVGATAADPKITCIIEHTGVADAMREDGQEIVIDAPSRSTSVAAGTRKDELGGELATSPLPFYWGRSPAANWRLSIEPEVMARSKVDLAQMTAVQIAIAYVSI